MDPIPLRIRSKKKQREDRTRRLLVAQVLEEHPVCQRCHRSRSTDVHEVVRRSQWAAGYLARSNVRALCRKCHIYVTEHPREAVEDGWSDWSHNRYLYEWEGNPK